MTNWAAEYSAEKNTISWCEFNGLIKNKTLALIRQ